MDPPSSTGLLPHVGQGAGAYEYWKTKYIRANIHPGQTIIDVGANVGYYTLHRPGFSGDSRLWRARLSWPGLQRSGCSRTQRVGCARSRRVGGGG